MALTRRKIAIAALDLVEQHGCEALTMKSLAHELNRKASSLYNHITGRQDLIEHMRAIIVENIETSSFASKPWDEALADWAHSYLDAFAARPNSIPLLATTPISDPSTLVMYETVVGSLQRAGWSDGRAVAVMRTIEAHVLGSALDIVAPGTLLTLRTIPNELTALRQDLQPHNDDRTSARSGFSIGIRALISGLKQESAIGTLTSAATDQRRAGQ